MKTTLLILSLFTFTHSLYAQDSHPRKKEVKTEEETSPAAASAMSTAHLDLMGGAVIPVGDISDVAKTRFGYGAQFLFAATPQFHIGAFYETSKGEIKNSEDLEVPVDLRFSYYGLVGQFYFDSTVYFQLKAGLSSIEASASVSGVNVAFTADEHPLIIGAGLGLNLPMTGALSFAPYAGIIHSFKKGEGTNEIDAYNMIEVMAALRFNF
jgi:hypothetical protein